MVSLGPACMNKESPFLFMANLWAFWNGQRDRPFGRNVSYILLDDRVAKFSCKTYPKLWWFFEHDILLSCYLLLIWGVCWRNPILVILEVTKQTNTLRRTQRELTFFLGGQLVLLRTQVMRLDDDSDEEHSPYAGSKGCAVSFLMWSFVRTTKRLSM